MPRLHIEPLSFKSFSITYGTFMADFPGHSHAVNCYEFHYVTEGKGELITDKHTYQLKKNTVYLTGANKYHMQKTDENDPMSEYCLYFETETIPDDLILNIFFKQTFWIGKANKTIKKLFKDIYELGQTNLMYSNRKTALLMLLLIYELVQLYEPKILELTDIADSNAKNDALITDWFFLYNRSKLSLKSLADSLGLSERQTQRMLKKNFGKNFQQKKVDSVLEHSKLMLTGSKATLSKIAEECGFYDSAAFCNFFKKHTGVTPTQYRNSSSKHS